MSFLCFIPNVFVKTEHSDHEIFSQELKTPFEVAK